MNGPLQRVLTSLTFSKQRNFDRKMPMKIYTSHNCGNVNGAEFTGGSMHAVSDLSRLMASSKPTWKSNINVSLSPEQTDASCVMLFQLLYNGWQTSRQAGGMVHWWNRLHSVSTANRIELLAESRLLQYIRSAPCANRYGPITIEFLKACNSVPGHGEAACIFINPSM